MTTSTIDTDERTLIEQARAGDRAAMGAVLERHRSQMYRYGMRVCATSADAEEAVQETLWIALRALRGFRGNSRLSTWLLTIVRRYCIRTAQQIERRLERAQDAAMPPPLAVDLDEPSADPRVRASLTEALLELPAEYREILFLRDLEGHTAPEAAQRLGISVDAAKSRLHRAREQLRGALLAKHPELFS